MTERLFHFGKVYTRDVSLILQETWYYGQQHGLNDWLGKKNPNSPFNIYYMNYGAIEVWDNKEAVQWLKDSILEKNLEDQTFLDRSIEWYENTTKPLKKGWKDQKLSSMEELKDFIKQAFVADAAFLVFYYSAVDERTPKKLRDKALVVRDRDTFFEDSDKTIRNTLKCLYPGISGFESTILSQEIDSPPSLEELKRRLHSSILIPEIFFEVMTLDEFRNQHQNYIFEHEKASGNQKEIRGQIAFKGEAKGIVRIIRRKSEVSNVRDGEIIVSPMTTPDYLPAMKKAAAFITDEGGITCHAAIVARELKKPCIIGTKIATKVLKDGDLVEVDAENGIVNIIEKAK